MGRRRRSLGMTLIESLVALAIVSMMLVSVWSTFGTTVDAMESTEKIQDRYSMLRNAMDRMAAEIGMAYLSFNRPRGETKQYTFFEGRHEGESDSLTFSSFAHLRVRKDSNESDQSIIQYVVEDDPEDSKRKHLYRRETKRLTGDLPEQVYRFAPAYVLCEDVESLEFRYWDPTRFEWLKEWRTTALDAQPDRLPTRVEIKLGFYDEADELVYFVTQVSLPMQEKIDLEK
ncbi:type II secretion system protein GspJ [Nannocystaceae bacterium ST9]